MAQIQRYGPYGDQEAVENFSLKLEGSDRIKEVIVRAGFVVDALGITIASANGDSDTSIFGGTGGHEYKIKLKIGEYITGISGKTKDSLISKLRIHTNLHPHGHGPYGTSELNGGCEFKSPMPLAENDHFAGFFGTAYDNLVSIGLYVEKNSQIKKWVIAKCGPYGSQCPENYSFKLQEGESIKEVIIRYGFIVDAIGFVVANPCGGTYTKMFGGNDPRAKERKIVLKCGEKITQISGTYGNYKYQNNECLIAAMKIHTNLCPTGYGPFGQGDGVDCPRNFSSPLLLDNPIVGVFGRHHNYLESIGLFYKKLE